MKTNIITSDFIETKKIQNADHNSKMLINGTNKCNLHCIKKVVLNGSVISIADKIITLTELREWSIKNELMVLGLVASTGELTWEEAPAWDYLQDVETTTLYHVTDPTKRIAKRFKSLPVNARLPYSVIEVESIIDTDTRAELECLITEADFHDEIEIYFELADKSGDVMKSGLCRQSFLERLKAWANDIGGSFYTEAIC
jgi:hypothetical protein